MEPTSKILAATYLRSQAKQLAEQIDGVRQGDDREYIHRARVAARRIRVAFRVFENCFPRKRLVRWRKVICRAAGELGDARDLDVQTDYLRQTLAALGDKELTSGVARVLVQLEVERERMQPRIIKAMDRLERLDTLTEMRRECKRIKLADSGENMDLFPLRHVLPCIEKFRGLQGSLSDPDDRAGHHRLRIAAKRLRYTLEIARSAQPGRYERMLESMKTVQSYLGDIHDCEVWLERLNKIASKWRRAKRPGRISNLRPGIEFLRRELLHRRGEAYRMLLECVDFTDLFVVDRPPSIDQTM